MKKPLVIGQEVYLTSGIYPDGRYFYCDTGKVIAVTSSGVDVERQHSGKLMHFDNDGNETETSHRYRLGFGPSQEEDTFHNVLFFPGGCSLGPEFQAWHLDDAPPNDWPWPTPPQP